MPGTRKRAADLLRYAVVPDSSHNVPAGQLSVHSALLMSECRPLASLNGVPARKREEVINCKI